MNKNSLLKKLFFTSLLAFSFAATAQTRTDNLVKDAADLYKAQNYGGVLRLLENEDSSDYRVNYLRIIAKYELLKDYREVIENAKNEAQEYIRKFGNKNGKYTSDVRTIANNLDLNQPQQQVALAESQPTLSDHEFPPISFADDFPDFYRYNAKLIRIGSPDYSLANNPKELSEIMSDYQKNYGENFFKGVANFSYYYEIGYADPSKRRKRLMLDMRSGKVYDVPEAGSNCNYYDAEKKEFDLKSNTYIVSNCIGDNERQAVYLWNERDKKFDLIENRLIKD